MAAARDAAAQRRAAINNGTQRGISDVEYAQCAISAATTVAAGSVTGVTAAPAIAAGAIVGAGCLVSASLD